MKLTKLDYHGRAIDGYGDDVKQYLANALHLDINDVSDNLCHWVEVNHYCFWYYCLGDDAYDGAMFDALVGGVEFEVKNHALPLVDRNEKYID